MLLAFLAATAAIAVLAAIIYFIFRNKNKRRKCITLGVSVMLSLYLLRIATNISDEGFCYEGYGFAIYMVVALVIILIGLRKED